MILRRFMARRLMATRVRRDDVSRAQGDVVELPEPAYRYLKSIQELTGLDMKTIYNSPAFQNYLRAFTRNVRIVLK